MIASPFLCAALLAAAPAETSSAPVAPPTVPAIGRDWMDMPDPVDREDDPTPWPRADSVDAGLEDMIHDERQMIGSAAGSRTGAGALPDRVQEHVFRALRKVGGDYIVVPVFTLHLDRGTGER